MDVVTVDDLDAASDTFDRHVDTTRGIDRVCSSSDWVVPSYRSWAEDSFPVVLGSDHGWAALTERIDVDHVRYLCPPESAWGFASPIVTSDPTTAGVEVASALDGFPGWAVLLLTGMVPDSEIERAMRAAFGARHLIRTGPTMTRCRADLADGADALIERRPGKWQRDLRRAQRRADERGFEVVPAGGDLARAFARLIDVERRSWKGREGSGLVDADLRRFYWKMCQRLGPQGRLRLHFARVDGRDVGYILGQVRRSTYRGLQISYDHSYRQLSIGTLLQAFQVRQLVAEGIRTYDLGMEMAYKRNWTDELLTTRTTVVVRR